MKGEWVKPEPSFPTNVLTALGQSLEDCREGNVAFELEDDGSGVTKRLYAHAALLSTRSLYFETGERDLKRFLIVELKSGFMEGAEPVSTSPDCCPRRTIRPAAAFRPFHVMLYYLFTGEVLLMKGDSNGVENPFGMPVVGVDQVFEVAHQYGITGLIDAILLYLAETCHPNDVLGHISEDFSLLYDEVYRMYEKVLAKYSEELKGSPELEAFCQRNKRHEKDEAFEFDNIFARRSIKRRGVARRLNLTTKSFPFTRQVPAILTLTLPNHPPYQLTSHHFHPDPSNLIPNPHSPASIPFIHLTYPTHL